MKDTIISLLEGAVDALKHQGVLPDDLKPTIKVDPTKDKAHGDYATNLALRAQRSCRCAAGKSPSIAARRELSKPLNALREKSSAHRLSHTQKPVRGFVV